MRIYWIFTFIASVAADTVEMIRSEGYTVSSHYFTTSDGYILNLHRIPVNKNGTRNGKVALLYHGFLGSSADWVILGPGKALAYILSDLGYDVWLGNFRGNRYSRDHVTLDPDWDSEFWYFSWHEFGAYDVPAAIDHILDFTGAEKLYYVGHSIGTTAFYVMGSEMPEYMDKVQVHVGLSPMAFMGRTTGTLLHVIAETDMSNIFVQIGVDMFFPSYGFITKLDSDVCSTSLGDELCSHPIFAFCGFDPDDINSTLLPTIYDNTPAGASSREALHYAQLANTSAFRQYDHGEEENLRRYGASVPPDYDLSKVTAPGYFVFSLGDWLSAWQDVEELVGKVGNYAEQYLLDDIEFNNLDYVYGNNATQLVYPLVVDVLEKN